MPTYEYKCTACGHAFEQFQSMTAAPIKRCPQCGKSKVKRLLGTGAGIIFKGSGFYITDYRDSSYKEKAKAESGASTGAGTGGNSDGSDSKPSTESKPAETRAESKSESKSDAKADSRPASSDKPAASKSADKTTKRSKK